MKRCVDCEWVRKFNPRKDETERGLVLGCNRPGWDGYTYADNPACGGVFFSPKKDIDDEPATIKIDVKYKYHIVSDSQGRPVFLDMSDHTGRE